MVLYGTVVNAIAIGIGCAIGLVCKKWISQKLSDAIFIGVGLVVLYMGFSGALKEIDITVLILCMIFGTAIGEIIDLDKRVTQLGNWIESKVSKGNNSSIAKAFVSSSLLFCVGAMSIVGSLESGLYQIHDTLIAKSVLDFIGAIVFTSTMGIGVVFSVFTVLLYQGGMALCASLIQPYLSALVIQEMSIIGSLIIVALGLNLVQATKIKIANLIPAMFLPILFGLLR